MCSIAGRHTNHHCSHTNLQESLYYQAMRFLLVQAYCYPDTMWEPPSEASNSLMNCKCGRCGEKGHYKSSKQKCRENPDYKGPDSISDYDSTDNEDTDKLSAFSSFSLSTKLCPASQHTEFVCERVGIIKKARPIPHTQILRRRIVSDHDRV